ncbi:hypothetical protein D3C75_360300 [compost metagenome]
MFTHAVPMGRRRQGLRQQRRRFQRRQRLSPELFGGQQRLLLNPAQIVAVLPQRPGQRLAGIVLDHFAEQLRVAPAVHEDVMAGMDQVPAFTAPTHQQQAEQWRGAEFEATAALLGGQCIEVDVGCFDHLQLQVDLAMNHLMRALKPQPVKAAAQDVVSVDRRLPGPAECRQLQPLDVQAQLIDVGLGLGFVQGVEQHALLHRRQRVNVLDGRCRDRQGIELCLGDARQREVRRRDLAWRCRAAMFDQCLEFFGVGIGQSLHRGLGKHVTAEAPLQRELPAIDLALHGQPVGQRCIVALSLAAAFRGRDEQRGVVELTIELPQVVEGDPWRRQVLQGLALRRFAQVAQQSIAQAFAGNGAQLLLDRLDRIYHPGLGLQAQRKQAGEPADGAAQVEVVGQVFAAVAFQLDQRRALPAPAADDPRQRREQQVIDLGAIGRRCLLQQPAGQFGVQCRFDLVPVALLQAALRLLTRQVPGIRQLRLPVRHLPRQGAGMLLQMRGPGLIGAGFLGQRHLPVSLLQVFEQHPP